MAINSNRSVPLYFKLKTVAILKIYLLLLYGKVIDMVLCGYLNVGLYNTVITRGNF
jgi:hypothetical protein